MTLLSMNGESASNEQLSPADLFLLFQKYPGDWEVDQPYQVTGCTKSHELVKLILLQSLKDGAMESYSPFLDHIRATLTPKVKISDWFITHFTGYNTLCQTTI